MRADLLVTRNHFSCIQYVGRRHAYHFWWTRFEKQKGIPFGVPTTHNTIRCSQQHVFRCCLLRTTPSRKSDRYKGSSIGRRRGWLLGFEKIMLLNLKCWSWRCSSVTCLQSTTAIPHRTSHIIAILTLVFSPDAAVSARPGVYGMGASTTSSHITQYWWVCTALSVLGARDAG